PALLVPVRNRTRHGGCSTGADAVPGARVRLGLRTTHDIARPVPRNGAMRVDTGRHLRENTPEPGPSGPRERFAPAPPPLLALPTRHGHLGAARCVARRPRAVSSHGGASAVPLSGRSDHTGGRRSLGGAR